MRLNQIFLILVGSCALTLGGDIVVSWDKVKNAEEYYIQYGTENVITRLTTANNQFKIENVTEGRVYFVTVKSINKSETSKDSEVLKFKVPKTKQNKPLQAPDPKLVFKN